MRWHVRGSRARVLVRKVKMKLSKAACAKHCHVSALPLLLLPLPLLPLPRPPLQLPQLPLLPLPHRLARAPPASSAGLSGCRQGRGQSAGLFGRLGVGGGEAAVGRL